MGYRHLIEEETINYFGTKCKFVDVNGVRFYDSNKVEMMTEEEMERCMEEHMLDIMEWDDNHPSLEELGLRYGGEIDFSLIDWDNWTLERITEELGYISSFDEFPVNIIKRTYTLLINGSRGKGEWIVVAASENAEVLRKIVYSSVDIESKRASRMWTDKDRMTWEDPKGENYYYKIIPTLEVADPQK